MYRVCVLMVLFGDHVLLVLVVLITRAVESICASSKLSRAAFELMHFVRLQRLLSGAFHRMYIPTISHGVVLFRWSVCLLCLLSILCGGGVPTRYFSSNDLVVQLRNHQAFRQCEWVAMKEKSILCDRIVLPKMCCLLHGNKQVYCMFLN